MNRRQFLGIAGSSILFAPSLVRDVLAREPSTIALAEGKDHAAITRAALEAMGGMKRFVKAGDTVVVKPNMGWDRRPEQGANTNPTVVKAVVEECLKAGAKRVKVFDNTCNEARRCYENSGIAAILKGMKNVEVKHIEEERFKKIALNGVFLKEWELYSEATSADVYINVPVAKHHGLTRLSLSLKNVMGIMGGNRGYIHRQIEDALADVNAVVKTQLTIMDATRILTNHGPQGGSLSDVKVLNRVLASTDMVAADAYATQFFGLAPKDIPITLTAYKRGLGEMNLEKIRVIKA